MAYRPPVPARRSRALNSSASCSAVETVKKEQEDVKIFSGEEVSSLRAQTRGMQRDNLSFVCLNHADFLEQMKHEEEAEKQQELETDSSASESEPDIQEEEIQTEEESTSPVIAPSSPNCSPQIPKRLSTPPRGSSRPSSPLRGRGTQNPMRGASTPSRTAPPRGGINATNANRGSPPVGSRGAPRGRPRGRGARGRGRGRGISPSDHRALSKSGSVGSPPSRTPTESKKTLNRSTSTVIKQNRMPSELLIKPTETLPFAPPGYDYVPSLGYFLPTIQARSHFVVAAKTEEIEIPRRSSLKLPHLSSPDIDIQPKPIQAARSKSNITTKLSPSKPRVKSQHILVGPCKPLEELIATEREFVADMNNVVIEIFLKQIRRKKLLNKFEIVSIFSNIETVVSVNKKLLEELRKPKANIGEIFSSFAAEMKRPYAIYCSNQPNVRDTLIEYKAQSEDLTKFLKTCFRKSECRKMDLESFLIMPLQRLCKYPLLLKEIQKSGTSDQDDKQMQSALDEIRSVVDDVNTRVREVENLVKLMSISNQISNGGKWPIIDPMRQFFMEGEMTLSGKKKYAFLFSDSLLLCEMQHEEQERKLTAYRMIPLSLAVTTDLPGDDKHKHRFELVEIGKDQKMIVTFATQLKKRKWLRALDNMIAHNSGPQDEAVRESVAQIKAVKPVVVAEAPRRKKKSKSKVNQAMKTEAVQNHPSVVALRQQIAAERKLREKAEEFSEELKRLLQVTESKESKQQRASDLQVRIGQMCGVVGQLSTANANLQQKLVSYQKEFILLAAP